MSIFEVNILNRFTVTSNDNINKYSKNILRNSADFKTNNTITNCFSNIVDKFYQHQDNIFDKFSNLFANKQTTNMKNISLVITKHLISMRNKLSVKEGNAKSKKGQVRAIISIYPNRKNEQLQLATTPITLPLRLMLDKRTEATTESLRPMPPNQSITKKSPITLIKYPQPMLMRSTVTLVLVIMETLQPMSDIQKNKLPVIARNGNITFIMCKARKWLGQELMFMEMTKYHCMYNQIWI